MINLHTPELQFAIQAVRQASLLVRHVQNDMVSPAMTKTDQSPVTVADFASQALVGCLLADAFPEDFLVAEENSEELCKSAQTTPHLEQVTEFVNLFIRDADPELVCAWIDRGFSQPSQRFWVLDPVDGTKGFLRGGQYVVALALMEDGLPVLSVLGCPVLSDSYRTDSTSDGSLIVAARGQGAWLSSLATPGVYEPLHISGRSDITQARVLRSFEAEHTNVELLDRMIHQLGIQAKPMRLDSQAKFAILAAGKGELLVRLLPHHRPNYHEKLWDLAAGVLILEEAGGRVTDLDGQPLDFTAGRELLYNRGVIASNGLVHEATLKALHSLGA